MKSGDTVTRDVLRVALSEIERATGSGCHRAIAGGDPSPDRAEGLPEDKQQAIVRKLIKSNAETISLAKESAQTAGEHLLKKLGGVVEQLESENKVLQELLPEAWTEEQIAQLLITKSIDVTQAKNDGQAMGMAMKALKAEPEAVVDASIVKKVVGGLRNK